jgi:hypothetical protein
MTSLRHIVAEYADRQAAFIRDLAEHIERSRQEQVDQGLTFTAVTPEQLEHKLKRSNSPMIVWQSWSTSTPVGGVLQYRVGVSNPDPVDYPSVYLHAFVGLANIAQDVDTAVLAVDTRFPQLTGPSVSGLVLKAGTSDQVSFDVSIPAVEGSTYLGNSVLFQATWHEPANYLDRGLFVFEVT